MAKAKTTTIQHEYLGAIDFNLDSKGHTVFSIMKIRQIIQMGIQVLADRRLLSETEKAQFSDLFEAMDIAIKKNLPGRSSIQHKYNHRTGEVIDAALYFSEISLYIATDEMIKSILENLCLLIVMYKHPEERLKESGLFGPNAPFDGHGDPWCSYAEALLPEDYVRQCKYAHAAYGYIRSHATKEQAEVFENEWGEGWESDLADQYAEELLGNDLTSEQYPIVQFLEDRLEEYAEYDSEDDLSDDDSAYEQEPAAVSSIPFEQYIDLMDSKYEAEIDAISDRLIMLSSYQRGPALYDEILEASKPELRYYLFIRYWTHIDAGHDLYKPSEVYGWLAQSNAQLDLLDLEIDSEGFVTVYRGENEHSLPWAKGALSWTTSRQIAEKFARGVRLRTQDAPKPRIVVGKVHISAASGH